MYRQNRLLTSIISVALCSLFVNVAHADPSWEIISPLPTPGNIVSLDFVDDDVGYLVTNAGMLMKTVNGGRNWSIIDVPNLSLGPWRVDFIDPQHGWLSGGIDMEEPWLQVIYTTENGGVDWNTIHIGSQEETTGLSSVHYFGDNFGWAAGETVVGDTTLPLVICIINEDSLRRVVLPDGNFVTLNDIHFSSRNFGWVVGSGGYTARTSDGGRSWTSTNSGIDEDLYAVYSSTPANVWAVGGSFQRGVVLHSVNGGMIWQRIDNNRALSRFVDVEPVGDGSVAAINIGGDASPSEIVSISNRHDWSVIYDNEERMLTSLSTVNNALWAGGTAGYLVTSVDGQQWETLSSGLAEGIFNDLYFTDEETGWCVGAAGALFFTENGGDRWRRIQTGIETELYSVHFRDQSRGWVTGDWSVELFTANGGDDWDQVDITDGDVRKIVFSGESGYAIHGRSVSVSRDDGENWQSTAVGGMGVEYISIAVPAPDIAYIAAPTDTLRRTTNGGDSWHMVNDELVQPLAVSFPDENHGWVVVGSRRYVTSVFSTDDGGQTWREREGFDFLVTGIHFTDSSKGCLWGSEGELLLTNDGGSHWQDMGLRISQMLWDAVIIDNENITLWICGENGLLARWNEEGRSVPDQRDVPTGTFVLTSVWPNPTNSRINIAANVSAPGIYNLSIFDVIGRIALSEQVQLTTPGVYPFSLSLDALPSGSYYFVLTGNSHASSIRVSLIK